MKSVNYKSLRNLIGLFQTWLYSTHASSACGLMKIIRERNFVKNKKIEKKKKKRKKCGVSRRGWQIASFITTVESIGR